MKCETGPIDRQFGGTDWIVYACDDGGSVVIVSKAGNPASPFYFVASPKDGSYVLNGEGTGSKVASDAAGDAINALGSAGFRQLFDAASHVKRAN
ncbi:hypothetical protein BH09PSE4_BH09PSE4_17700 [soil metagenome]